MKENLFKDNFIFKLDTDFINDIDCLLTFIRQPLCLEKLFKKIPSDILQEKLNRLEFKFERRRNIPYFLITHNNPNKIIKFELTNNHLSSLGITITDQNHLVKPLLDAKNKKLGSNLKDFLTTLVEDTNNNNNKLNLKNILSSIKNKILNLPENKNKQTEINIFFKFLKKILEQKNNHSTTSLINYAKDNFLSWFTSEKRVFVLSPVACYSKKYNEIGELIAKLYSLSDTSYLANSLKNLNDEYLQQLFNIYPCEEEILKSSKAIKIIQDFQLEVSKLIKEYLEENLLSLAQLNIFYKILNAITRLIPKFIVNKQTRVNFFQQYTPQKEILLEIEKSTQPFLFR